VGKLVATDYDCDQACNLCNCAGEEGLHSRESGVERRLCVCEGGQEEKQGYDAKVWGQAAPEDSPQPTVAYEIVEHWHLRRPRQGRDMPKA
jgi:hypothetical protein